LFIVTQQEEPLHHVLRNLIVIGENSKAIIIEQYANLTSNVYLTNTITEIKLEKNATLEHYKLQQESEQAFHMGTIYTKQQCNSHFYSHSIALGGALVRSDIQALLNGEHSECILNGLYLPRHRQHIDHHTFIDHAMPYGTSREYYKGVLNDNARAVFNGKVLVRPYAHKTNAQQTNKNLLLSVGSEIDTKPQLEIYNDDVKCTHGAAVGQLNEEALFYLQSRGINKNDARSLLVYAFVREVIENISLQFLCKHLQLLLNKRLAAEIVL
jgi:Fe-S cluster assembly protein SufD